MLERGGQWHFTGGGFQFQLSSLRLEYRYDTTDCALLIYCRTTFGLNGNGNRWLYVLMTD